MIRNVLFFLLAVFFLSGCSESPTESDDDFGDIKDPGAIRIGLMDDAVGSATITRLNALASDSDMLDSLGITEFSITNISSEIASDSLSRFTIIYLPVGWAAANSTTYENINTRGTAYMNYVENGGGLFIEQPNPHQRPDNSITIEFLPYPITLSNGLRG